jgi:hypothetical protein
MAITTPKNSLWPCFTVSVNAFGCLLSELDIPMLITLSLLSYQMIEQEVQSNSHVIHIFLSVDNSRSNVLMQFNTISAQDG